MLAPVALAALLAIPVGTVKATGGARVIWDKETEYQYARVVEERDGERQPRAQRGPGDPLRATGPGEWLTGDYWDEMLVLPFAAGAGAPRSVAILGNAAGTTARAYGHFFPRTRVDAVEIDGALTDVGRRLFDLRGPNLHTAHGRRPAVPAPRRRAATTSSSSTPTASRTSRSTSRRASSSRSRASTSRRGGMVVINVGHPERSDRLEKVLSATMGAELRTVLRDPSEPTNTMLVGTDAPVVGGRAARRAPGGCRRALRPVADATAGRLAPPLRGGRSTPTTWRRSSG